MPNQNNTTTTKPSPENIKTFKLGPSSAITIVKTENEIQNIYPALSHLLVLNIPKTSTPRDVRDHFSTFGKVLELKVHTTSLTSSQLAYISFIQTNQDRTPSDNTLYNNYLGSNLLLIHKISSNQLKEIISNIGENLNHSECSRNISLQNLPSSFTKK